VPGWRSKRTSGLILTRQLRVTGLGHDQPTLLITNRPALPARQVISSHARWMNNGQRLAEAISSFGLDALAGAVPLNVDLDVVLCVLAHTICAAATPDTLQRRFLNTGGIIEDDRGQTTIRLARWTYSPILRQASLRQMAGRGRRGRRCFTGTTPAARSATSSCTAPNAASRCGPPTSTCCLAPAPGPRQRITLPSPLLRALAAIVGEPHVLTGDAAAGFAVHWTGRFRGLHRRQVGGVGLDVADGAVQCRRTASFPQPASGCGS
jgi:hypothetical protein